MNVRAELAEVVEVLARATPGEWEALSNGTYWDGAEGSVYVDLAEVVDAEFVHPPGAANTIRGQMMLPDAQAIAAAVNFLRAHHAALAAALEQGEADRVDAGRYRFYRSTTVRPILFGDDGWGEEDIDQAIDEAIRAREGGQGG